MSEHDHKYTMSAKDVRIEFQKHRAQTLAWLRRLSSEARNRAGGQVARDVREICGPDVIREAVGLPPMRAPVEQKIDDAVDEALETFDFIEVLDLQKRLLRAFQTKETYGDLIRLVVEILPEDYYCLELVRRVLEKVEARHDELVEKLHNAERPGKPCY